MYYSVIHLMSVWERVEDFREHFYSLVAQIPEGKVTSYGTLAEALGDQRAARAVGKMLNENPRPGVVPCHRVVRSSGELGGFGMGVDEKIRMLKEEGVDVEDNSIVDFQEKFYDDFEGEPVLEQMRSYQLEKREEVIDDDEHGEINHVAGVDVSYDDHQAYGAASIWDGEEEIGTVTVKKQIDFPYIPTYLAFREYPVLADLVDELRENSEHVPDVIMVDGNGIMHPLQFGLASNLGVEKDIPTVGVAKSLLLGDVQEPLDQDDPLSEVLHQGKTIGYAYLSTDRVKKPIYVSPGHRVSLQTSLNMVKKYCRYKVPDPIRRAHILATERRKNS